MSTEGTDVPGLAEGDRNDTPRRAAWQAANLDAETRSLLEEDARYFLHQTLSTPCLNVLAHAEGSWLTDVQGRRYLDFHGNSVHQVGFGNPRVVAAIKAQLDALPFSTRRYTNRPAIALARKLAELAPGDLSRVLFTTGGASANSVALQLARVATGRHKTISMWDAFHGGTLDTISVGGEAAFRASIGPLMPGTEHVPPPDPYRCAFGCAARGGCDLACADYLEYVLEKEGDVAAVIAESVRNTPYIPEAGYWRRVREACDRHGALLILDEIPHALGRTGRFFTCENFEVVPDILVIGKGLGGGVFPLAAVIAREGLNRFAAHRSLGHFTHEKNPVACAAGLATIEEIESRGLVEHARRLGERALAELRSMATRHPLVGDVRGIGLLMGVELVRDRGTRARAVDETEAVMYAALSRGLSFKTTMGNIINLTPPLTITREEMDLGLSILDQSLAEVEAS